MPRSLRVAESYINTVKIAVQKNGFARQRNLAEEVQMSLSTISSFLNGRPVDYLNFIEICSALNLDEQEIANFENVNHIESSTSQEVKSTDIVEKINDYLEAPEEFSTYIERSPIEKICYQTVSQPGSLLRIKAPKRMGKSLLLNKIHEYSRQQNYAYVSVSCLLADNTILTSSKKFLTWFCSVVSQQLELPNKLAEVWEEDLGDNYNCTMYFGKYLLKSLTSPLVLALDNIEMLLGHPKIAEDFFGILRAWNEMAKTRSLWKNLRLVISYSTEIYIPLNINHSPFNVGIPIELPEFTLEQIAELVERQNLDFTEAGVDEQSLKNLYALVGGHPYLIQRAIYCLKQKQCNLEELLETASTDSGIYKDHLRGQLAYLQEFPELVEIIKQVIRDSYENVVQLDPISTFKLQSLGLVKFAGQGIKPASQLYQLYFSKYL